MADSDTESDKLKSEELYYKPASTVQPKSDSADVERVGEGDEFDTITKRFIVAQQTTSISGPLPPSTEFASYDRTLPGAANRIMSMAEKEQDARLFENRWLLGIKTIFSFSGQTIAAYLVYTVLKYAYDLALKGHTEAAIALGTTTIGAILATFLVPKLLNSNSRDTKQEDRK